MIIIKQYVENLLNILKDGIQHGAGDMDRPGSFCVEQAVSHAIGHDDHSDHPRCVTKAVRDLGISLNDREWSSEDRAKGLKRFAVAQLGSYGIVGEFDFNQGVTKRWNAKYDTYYTTAQEIVAELISRPKLVELAEMAVQVLIELKSPGTEFLYMCNDPQPKPEHQAIVDRMKAPQLTWGNYNAGTSQACPTSHCS